MTWETSGGAVLVIGAIATLIFGIYKLRPESDRISVETAKSAAEGAKLSMDMAHAGRDELVAELAAEKFEHAKYREDAGAHMADLSAQLRGKKAEVVHLTAERDRALARIAALENGGRS